MSDKLAKAVEPFGCQLVEGVMSHQMKQHIIDGNKCVLNRTSPEHRVEDAEFEPNEVYAVDIVVSTGEGCWHAWGAGAMQLRAQCAATPPHSEVQPCARS